MEGYSGVPNPPAYEEKYQQNIANGSGAHLIGQSQVYQPSQGYVQVTSFTSPSRIAHANIPVITERGEEEEIYSEEGSSLSALAITMNILWIILGGGLWMYIIYMSLALLAALTIVGYPVAKEIVLKAHFVLIPYGKGIRQDIQPQPCTILLQMVWFPFGIMVYLSHIGFCCLWVFSLIGIPFAFQHFRLARFALWPVEFTTYNKRFGCKELFDLRSYTSDQISCYNQPPSV